MAVLYKNPIGRALGQVLKDERVNLGLSVEDATNAMGGVAESFYNLVENGTNYLHVNKSLALVRAFEGRLHLDATCKILMVISSMEAAARSILGKNPNKSRDSLDKYVNAIALSIEEISICDQHKLGKLLKIFDDTDLLKSLSKANAKDAEKILRGKMILEELRDFLTGYEAYGLQIVDARNNFLMKKINQTPSIYTEFITDTVEKLVRLPVKLERDQIWRWEKENKHKFVEQICITLDVESVVSNENLEKYHYDLLWEEKFRRARFIFFSDEHAGDLKNRFSILLRERLVESCDEKCDPNYIIERAKYKLSNFESALNKVQFQCISDSNKNDSKLTLLKKNILDKEHRAINFFVFEEHDAVGLLARLSGDNGGPKNELVDVDSLSILEVEKRLSSAQELWENIEND